MRRAPWAFLLIASFVLVGAVAWWMAGDDLEINDARASVLSLAVGWCTLLLALAGVLRRWQGRSRDDSLSGPRTIDPVTHAGYLKQMIVAASVARDHALSRPQVLPLSWTSAAPELGDGVPAPPAGSRIKGRKRNRLDVGFRRAIRDLAAHYRRIAGGRLVILGEPGAGKSVLSFMLVRGLLEEWRPGERVPLLLSAASWDPTREKLGEWIVRTLAVAYYSGAREIPRSLFDHDLLLPVIDGLDEMPEFTRRLAVRAVNEALARDRPIVLACRSAEYAELIGTGSPPLRQSPVIELEPLDIEDVTAYLRAVDWVDPARLEPLFAHLDAHPGGVVEAALATPLTVSMLRSVCERGGDLDPVLRLPSRAAVEDALVGAAIGEPSRARRWLSYLAGHLHEHRERELAWWRLSGRLLSSWAVIGLAVLCGVALTLLSWAWMLIFGDWEDAGLNTPLLLGAYIGGGFAVLAIIAWYAGDAAATPGRLAPAAAGSAARLRRGMATGLALAAIPVLPVLIGIGVVITFVYGWPPENTEFYLSALTLGLAAMVVTGLALAVHRWLNGSPERSGEAGPVALLVEDRRSSLVSAAVAGAVVGLGAGPVLIVALVAVRTLQALVTGWSGEPSLRQLIASVLPEEWSNPLLLGAVVLLPGIVFASLTLLTRAWSRFVWVRFVLALHGRLPWRFMAFLEDAHRQGILQHFGGEYQFRHIRMQDWLASTALRPPEPSPQRHVRGRIAAFAGVAVALVVCVALVRALPPDSSSRTLLTGMTTSMRFLPDGRTMVVGRADGRIQLWDLETGRPIGRSLPDGFEVAFGTAGRLVATLESQVNLSILDLRTGAELCRTVLPRSSDEDPTLLFSPDGRVLLTSLEPGNYQLWEPRTCTRIGGPMASGADIPKFSPDGGVLVVREPFSEVLTLWNARTGARIDDGTIAGSSHFTPDGRILVTVNAGTHIWLFDSATGKVLDGPLPGYSPTPVAPIDGSRAYLIRWSSPSGSLAVRRLWGDQRTFTFPGVLAQDISGGVLAGVLANGEIRLWSLDDGSLLGSIDTGTRVSTGASVELSPDGRSLRLEDTADRGVEYWDVGRQVRVGAVEMTGDVETWFVPGARAAVVAELSKDGRRINRFIDLDTGETKPVTIPVHEGWTNSRGNQVAYRSTDTRAVEVWDLATGRRATLTGHTGEIDDVRYSFDDRLLASRSWSDGTIRLWPAPF
ncbi:NACHT and WD40 repeat domain-containing protein [Nonomuraea dietziae]|uniref:NACHT and WD40 repeat domain-containing protein n=1 Tax=Nonomuraea dietziae TaxID=65515 RepID=UPI003411244C